MKNGSKDKPDYTRFMRKPPPLEPRKEAQEVPGPEADELPKAEILFVSEAQASHERAHGASLFTVVQSVDTAAPVELSSAAGVREDEQGDPAHKRADMDRLLPPVPGTELPSPASSPVFDPSHITGPPAGVLLFALVLVMLWAMV